jgi:hypothetical protein
MHLELSLCSKGILSVPRTKSFHKIAVLGISRRRQEGLLPPEGKVAIVPRQQKVLHMGRGRPLTNCAPSSKLSRADRTCSRHKS